MKKYFLHDGINQYGPFDLAELETKIITPQTMIWYESLPEWKAAGEIEELKGLLNSKVPASQFITPPTIASKGEDWSKKSYYYSDDHGQQGPFTLEQLKSRPIKANTSVWYDPLPEWTTADKVAGLKDIISNHVEKVSSVTTTTTTIVQKESTTQRAYYYMDNGVQQGPFSLEQLKGKAITSATSVWYEPLPQWTTAGQLDELKDIITHTQTPVTATTSERLYYYTDNIGQQGPFTLQQLKGRPITGGTSVWYDPLPQWTTAAQIAELKDIINAVHTSSTTVTSQSTSQRSYYYADNFGQQGPFSLEQMKSKPITAATSVWYDPLPQWTTASQVPELSNIISHSQTVTTSVTPQSNSQRLYYYSDSAGQQGPFTLEQMKSKSINTSTSVWYDPLPQWTTAGQVPELKNILAHVQTVTAPVMPQNSSQRLYYYADGAGQQGPFTLEQLKTRPITGATSVWYDPLPQWTTAGQVPELRDIINGVGNASQTLFYYSDSSGQQGPFTLEQLRGRRITAATPIWYDPLPQWTTAGQVAVLRSILVG